MRLFFLSLLLLSICCVSLQADITSYFTFAQENHTYNSINGTVLPSLQADDAIDTLDIGFNFPYGNDVYTQLIVSTNGWIGLGLGMNSPLLVNQLSNASCCPVLAPLWDDLSMAAGDVSYLLSGTAPQRILTIQYHNARWNTLP
jgi:hypothetical protein